LRNFVKKFEKFFLLIDRPDLKNAKKISLLIEKLDQKLEKSPYWLGDLLKKCEIFLLLDGGGLVFIMRIFSLY
jgi:hypothetical protein